MTHLHKKIKLRPKKWTKHHTHRILHLSGLIIALALFVLCSWVFGTQIVRISANDVTRGVGVGVTIASITEGPTTVDNGGQTASGSSATAAPTPVPTPPSAPAVTAAPQPVFNTQHPKFSGHTNIRNALVHLEVHSDLIITANVYANESGDWVWNPAVPIPPGNHKLYITATDPVEPKITAKAVMEFEIILAPGQTVELPTKNNATDVGNGGNLFDVIVAVAQQFKSVEAGQEVVAKIKFVNFGKVGHPVDVEAQFVIRDAAGETVMKTSQTVAVATQLSIIKSFYTAPSMAPGIYTLTVSVPSEDLVANATDVFEIKAPALALTDSQKPPINFSIMFQILTGMLLVFSLILYLEYNKVEMISQTIRVLDEQDLVN